MIGCDKFCTYCIVPKVRGPEQSRPPEHILAEVRRLAEEGCREVTLLGQTVNSYKYRQGERTVRLADLLEMVHPVEGIDRIKFVTNFPLDMTQPLLEAVRDFIVGFCGETEEDFQQTVRLVQEGRFKNSYIFKYSPRPGTKAHELFHDDVPEEVKRRRNNQLLELQNRISLELNEQFIGREVEVLVEGPSKLGQKQVTQHVGPELYALQ